MQIGTYLTKQISSNVYTFNSVGPKGIIELRIIISKDDQEESIYYNLAFGVWNKKLGDIDDNIELRNGDMDRILVTVAQTALLFMKTHPRSLLYIQGSDSIRTRKYQMGISRYIDSVPPNMGILGLINEIYRMKLCLYGNGNALRQMLTIMLFCYTPNKWYL